MQQQLRSLAAGPSSAAAAGQAPGAWRLYFPDVAYTPGDRRALLLQELAAALAGEAGWRLLTAQLQPAGRPGGEAVLTLDYGQLSRLCDSADLAAALAVHPAEGLACLQAAAHEVRCSGWLRQRRHGRVVLHAGMRSSVKHVAQRVLLSSGEAMHPCGTAQHSVAACM